jgi:hypothetical protein
MKPSLPLWSLALFITPGAMLLLLGALRVTASMPPAVPVP